MILFGSRAMGDHLKNSDCDIIIVSREFLNLDLRKRIIKVVENPTNISNSKFFCVKFEKTAVDEMMLREELSFELIDKCIFVSTKIVVEFDASIFRPAEVPILLSDTKKIQDLGFKIEHSIKDIIRDRLN